MNLEVRVAWLSASWIVCSAAALGLVGWLPVATMGLGAWFLREDQE